jgi:hypothetical protein
MAFNVRLLRKGILIFKVSFARHFLTILILFLNALLIIASAPRLSNTRFWPVLAKTGQKQKVLPFTGQAILH